MGKQISTPMLAVSAIIVWLAACGLLTWVHFAYDGAVNGNPVYFWVYGGAILLAGATDTIHIYRSICCIIFYSGGSCCYCWAGLAFRHTSTAASAAP